MNQRLREQRREGTLVLLTTTAFALALFFSHWSFVEAEKEALRKKSAMNDEALSDLAAFEVGGADLQTKSEIVEVVKETPAPVVEQLTTSTPTPGPKSSPVATERPTRTAQPRPVTQIAGGDLFFGGFAPALENSRVGHVAGFANSRLLVAGGTDGTEILTSLEVLDYVSREYITVENSLIPRIWASAVVWSEHLVVLGGVNLKSTSTGAFQPVQQVEMINFKNLLSQQLTIHPNPRVRAGAAFAGGKIFYIGGSLDGEMSGEVNIYDTATNIWSLGTPMPNPREVAVVAKDGLIYAAGGRIPGSGSVYFHVYDPSTNVWTAKPALPEPRSLNVAFSTQEKIWLLGDETFSNVALVYDVANSLWSRKVISLFERLPRYGAAALVNQTALIVGGTLSNDNLPVNAIWSINIEN